MKTYAISDIHGFYDEMIESLNRTEFPKMSKCIFLGDYVDYGLESGKVVKYLFDLQEKHGNHKVIVLKGNHEEMLIDWYKKGRGDWFIADSDAGLRTFYSFISDEAKEEFDAFAMNASGIEISEKARELLKRECHELMIWLDSLPLYYKTKKQIYVHAGIDEEAEDLWEVGTSKDIFLWKYPPTKGAFLLTIISGHIGTCSEYLSGDSDYHDIFFDNESHYFIDGSVYRSGRIPVLVYDDDTDKYSYI